MRSQELRFGVLLPTREQAMAGTFDGGPIVGFAQRAELLGFDSVWAGDSLLARPRLDPLVVLAAVAGATSTIQVGTAALTPALRHPLVGAAMIASLDQVAGGRVVMGLGSGFPMAETEAEFAAVGASFDKRASRLDDIVELWRTAWSADPSEAASHHGRFFEADQLERLAKPHRALGPPLWLAGSDTPRVLERVATRYDGWMPFLPSAQAYSAAWTRIQDRADEVGRRVTPSLYGTVTTGASRESAAADLDTYVRGYYGRSLDQMSSIQAYGWGSTDDVVEWLCGYVDAGARHLVIRIGNHSSPEALDELAETVIPAVRAHATTFSSPRSLMEVTR